MHASQDGADVATPISLIEWFLAFYEQMQEGSCRPREAVVRAGELLFVPRGWWHMALNLEVGSETTWLFKSDAVTDDESSGIADGPNRCLIISVLHIPERTEQQPFRVCLKCDISRCGERGTSGRPHVL